MPSKAALRSELRSRLAQLSPESSKTASASITHTLLTELPPGLTVAVFSPTRTEPDLTSFFRNYSGRLAFPRVTNLGKRESRKAEVRAPRLQTSVTAGGEMDFHFVSDFTTLTPGAFGIREPNQRLHPKVAPQDLDLILVPGLAFTRSGQRLGQGGGFYDRFLKRLNVPTLGIAYECQLFSELPCEVHDQGIDNLLTEKGLTFLPIVTLSRFN